MPRLQRHRQDDLRRLQASPAAGGGGRGRELMGECRAIEKGVQGHWKGSGTVHAAAVEYGTAGPEPASAQ